MEISKKVPNKIIEQFYQDQADFLADNEYLDYAWSLDSLQFEISNEIANSVYAFVPVGTWSPQTEQFRWAWSIETFPKTAQETAAVLKQMQNVYNVPQFTQQQFDCPHMELDELLAAVHHHLNSKIIFKEKNMEPWLFFALTLPQKQ
ncbi:MAG: hypothetical protein JXX29_00975 [Deltaproteobacteria bacterium]|nr:hypothetical protein [Deltaproteobacteria bacterium]MBN2670211.1 hypothetical protein [Deltaproteobacteria bacterium]